MNDVTILAASNLVKTFSGARALDGISFSIRRGVVTGLIGPDGAGKTTLMRLTAGLLAPDSGSIRVLDLDATIHAATLRAIRRPHGTGESRSLRRPSGCARV
jgi:ABC-2 type transport system ATP-binding protein